MANMARENKSPERSTFFLSLVLLRIEVSKRSMTANAQGLMLSASAAGIMIRKNFILSWSGVVLFSFSSFLLVSSSVDRIGPVPMSSWGSSSGGVVVSVGSLLCEGISFASVARRSLICCSKG